MIPDRGIGATKRGRVSLTLRSAAPSADQVALPLEILMSLILSENPRWHPYIP